MYGIFPLTRLKLRGGYNKEDAEGMRETMRRKRFDDEEKMLAVSAESALELESRYEEQALYRAEQQQQMLASGDVSSFRDANLSLPFGDLGNESSIRNAALEELDERIARLRASDTESGARKQRNEGHRKEIGQNSLYAPAESARAEPAEYGPLGEILGNHYLSGKEREGDSGWEEEEEDAEALERARALIAEGLPRVPGLEEMRADLQQASEEGAGAGSGTEAGLPPSPSPFAVLGNASHGAGCTVLYETDRPDTEVLTAKGLGAASTLNLTLQEELFSAAESGDTPRMLAAVRRLATLSPRNGPSTPSPPAVP
jgi:hypothetical protein